MISPMTESDTMLENLGNARVRMRRVMSRGVGVRDLLNSQRGIYRQMESGIDKEIHWPTSNYTSQDIINELKRESDQE